jgi:hypothetical protein
MKAELMRFWFEFDVPDFNSLKRGCGVTAYSYDDAILLLQQSLFRNNPMPLVADVIENVDIRTLDQGHIIPNIGAPSLRGVWYPNLTS